MEIREFNWSRDLRFITDRIDNIPDPVERLYLLNIIRVAVGDLLTAAYERACWDARVADREKDALATGIPRNAFLDYSKRWNGRLEGSARIRWTDPIGRHRREHIEDLTEVAKGNSPHSVRTGWRQPHPDPAPEAQAGL